MINNRNEPNRPGKICHAVAMYLQTIHDLFSENFGDIHELDTLQDVIELFDEKYIESFIVC